MEKPQVLYFYDFIKLMLFGILFYICISIFLSLDTLSLPIANNLLISGDNVLAYYLTDLSRKYLIALREIMPLFIATCVFLGSSCLLFYRRIDYIRVNKMLNSNPAILKINLPSVNKEVHELMENIFESLHENLPVPGVAQSGIGATRRIFSFEMAATNGKLTYYIRCERDNVAFILNTLQGQYKGLKITEVDEYLRPDALNYEEYESKCYEYKLAKSSVFPINTYVDLRLEDDGAKDEDRTRLGPMGGFFETTSSLSKDEYFYMQFIMRGSGGTTRKSWSFLSKDFWEDENFQTEANEQVEKIKNDALMRNKSEKPPENGPEQAFKRDFLYPKEAELIDRIDRKSSKAVYEVGMRSMYVRKRTLQTPDLDRTFKKMFRRLGSKFSNNIYQNRGHSNLGWILDKNKWTIDAITKQTFHHYRLRFWFYYPMHFQGTTFVTPIYWYRSVRERMYFSSEELASILYFPRITEHTESLESLGTKRAEAPLNLPQ